MKTIWKTNPDRPDVGTRPDYFTHSSLSPVCLSIKTGKRVSVRGVEKRAKRQKWPHTVGKGPGGDERRYKLEDLPEDAEDVRIAILEYYGELREEDITAETEELNGATQKQKDRVAVWRTLLEVWKEWSKAHGGLAGKKELRGQFVELVKQAREREETTIPGLLWRTCRDIGRISVRTLERQEERFRRGAGGLIRRQGGHNRGAMNMPPLQQARIRGIMKEEPDWGAKRIATILKAEFKESAANQDSVRRQMKRVIEEDPGYRAFCRSSDEYKSGFQPASGNSSARWLYPLHGMQMDSTVSDVICNDGNRYSWIGIKDIFSGKAIYKLFPTSNRHGVLSVIATVIEEWGIPENIIMDNGLDYQSKAVQGSIKNLQAHGIKLRPYAPDDKGIIERMMRIRAGFEEVLRGYAGHNVRERQTIRSRRDPRDKSRRTRETMETNLSPAELQIEMTRYLEKVYHNRPQKGKALKGVSPNEKWVSSPHRPKRVQSREQLLIMMLPAERRVMLKDGLHLDGRIYWHSGLSCEVGKTFLCRQYPGDISLLCVTTPEPEKFLYWAKDVDVHKVTAAQAIRDKRHATKERKKKFRSDAAVAGEMFRNPRAEELAMAQEPRAKVQPLHAGGRNVSGMFADMAYAAGQELKEIQERGNPASAEEVFAAPHQEYGERKAQGRRLRLADAPEDDKPETPNLQRHSAIDAVLYYLSKPKDGLTTDELERARNSILDCVSYVSRFISQWSVDNQRWIAELVPERFWRYADHQTRGIPVKAQEKSK